MVALRLAAIASNVAFIGYAALAGLHPVLVLHLLLLPMNGWRLLEIVQQERAGNYLKYLLSGGLNFRQLLPDAMSPVVGALQWLLRPLGRVLSLHHAVVLRKKALP